VAQIILQLEDKTYPCEIVHSKRARYLRIKLTNTGALSVVVPKRVGGDQVKAFVLSQTDWVEQKLKGLSPVNNRPNELELTYIDEIWAVEYHVDQQLTSLQAYTKDASTIQCFGAVDDIALLHKVLGQWLKGKAEEVIPDRLAALAELHGFHFNRVTIRGQKTRWGSCSSSKNINLNYKLLFLEPPLVDYVLIHELCHTLEMNHSARFWELVADCDVNYKQHDKELNKIARTIPL
jgi:predicted metal-dependent hydrolase